MTLLDRLTSQFRKNGKSRAEARILAITSLQKSGNLKPGSTIPTTQGIVRGRMTPEERAIERAQRRHPGDYKYNPHNNTAVKGDINEDVKPRA